MNERFGDPEAQVLLPLFESDPYQFMAEAAAGSITSIPRFSDRTAVTVVLASEGYPGTPRDGDPIEGWADANDIRRSADLASDLADGLDHVGPGHR